MSEHWTWWKIRKGATLSLAKLHPALGAIEMEQRPRDWIARVVVDGVTYQTSEETRPEALAELLNYDDLLEALRKGA